MDPSLVNDAELHEFLKDVSFCDMGIELEVLDNSGWDEYASTSTSTGTAIDVSTTVFVNDMTKFQEDMSTPRVCATVPPLLPPCAPSPRSRLQRARAQARAPGPARSAGRAPTARGRPPPRGKRNRRRNPEQRDRENISRQLKQQGQIEQLNRCLDAEEELRGYLRDTLQMIAREKGVSIEEAVAMAPPDLQQIMARAEDVMVDQYRNFTGQKHICEKLNGFPTWPSKRKREQQPKGSPTWPLKL